MMSNRQLKIIEIKNLVKRPVYSYRYSCRSYILGQTHEANDSTVKKLGDGLNGFSFSALLSPWEFA